MNWKQIVGLLLIAAGGLMAVAWAFNPSRTTFDYMWTMSQELKDCATTPTGESCGHGIGMYMAPFIAVILIGIGLGVVRRADK